MAVLKYLTGYPEPLVAQVSELLAQGKLGPWLQQRYPDPHEVRSDRQLYDYTQELKDRYRASRCRSTRSATTTRWK